MLQAQERPFYKSKAKFGKEEAQQQVGSSAGLPGENPLKRPGWLLTETSTTIDFDTPKSKRDIGFTKELQLPAHRKWLLLLPNSGQN